MRRPGSRGWQGIAIGCCAFFLASISQRYHPEFGLTPLIGLSEAGHPSETPTLQALPHYDNPGYQGYDGVYYLQLALDPLLRDSATDRAMDDPPYRARRILFSWTAWAAGLGRPAWILQAYAAQNIVLWVVLAWVMTRWLNPVTSRGFALWFAVMFSDGLMASVHLALVDGPGMLLLALAVAAMERGRTWTSAAVLGLAGVARETNLLGIVTLRGPTGWPGWLKTAGAALVVVLPALIWQDYVWSIYRGGSAAAGVDHITPPFLAWLKKWSATVEAIQQLGLFTYAGSTLLVVMGLSSQAVYLAWRRAWRDPWWRLATAYAVLMLLVDYVVWSGFPGAISRVVLPMTFGFNVLLATERRGFWAWFVAGNLHLVSGVSGLSGVW